MGIQVRNGDLKRKTVLQKEQGSKKEEDSDGRRGFK
jgi:hypothetical protein